MLYKKVIDREYNSGYLVDYMGRITMKNVILFICRRRSEKLVCLYLLLLQLTWRSSQYQREKMSSSNSKVPSKGVDPVVLDVNFSQASSQGAVDVVVDEKS
ncbi:hypothetical protein ACFX12_000308 [Malus domestica]